MFFSSTVVYLYFFIAFLYYECIYQNKIVYYLLFKVKIRMSVIFVIYGIFPLPTRVLNKFNFLIVPCLIFFFNWNESDGIGSQNYVRKYKNKM